MQKQVDKKHYEFGTYVHKRRWASMWHQLDEVIKLNPERVLEVGPGPGLFKATAAVMGVHVETLDLDPDLEPDHVAPAEAMHFKDDEFDVVCAFQLLEHVPYEKSLAIFANMARVARKGMVLSLPDAAPFWSVSCHIPRLGVKVGSIPKPRFRAPQHQFDGQHYWEINKAGYPLKKLQEDFFNAAPVRLTKTYRVNENPYHRFFVYEHI